MKLPAYSYGLYLANCIKFNYKPSHAERRNAIKQCLDRSWRSPPFTLSQFRYEQLALLQDNVISYRQSKRVDSTRPRTSSIVS